MIQPSPMVGKLADDARTICRLLVAFGLADDFENILKQRQRHGRPNDLLTILRLAADYLVMHATKPRYRAVLEAPAADDDGETARSLRSILKVLLRRFGWKCIEVEPVKEDNADAA